MSAANHNSIFAHKHLSNRKNEKNNMFPTAKKPKIIKAVLSKSIGFMGLFLNTKVDVFARFFFKGQRKNRTRRCFSKGVKRWGVLALSSVA